MFISKDIITSHLNKIELFNNDESNNFPYKDFEDLKNSIPSNDKKKIVLSTSISSEYELLIKRFIPNINEITNIQNAKEGLNIINSRVISLIIQKKITYL